MFKLKKLRNYGGEIKRTRIAKPDPVTGSRVLNLEDPYIQEVFNRLGRKPSDYRVAKRVAKLHGKYPQGTIPELVTMDYLDQKGYKYTYQAWVNGGRSRRGGVVPDFVVQVGGIGMAWNVQGEYWHSRPEVIASDAIDRLQLIGHYFEYIFIQKIVNLWENDIYHHRPKVFELAEMGISMRGDGLSLS